MKKGKRLLICIIMCAAMVLACFSTACAADGKVIFNDPTVTVGDNVTVTMKVSCDEIALGSMDVSLTYDEELLQYVSADGPSGFSANGDGGGIKVSWYDASGADSVLMKFVFKTLGEGEAVVKPSSAEISSIDESPVNIAHLGQAKVTVSAPVQASSEARLSSLKVGPGTLSPAFSSDVYDYSITVPYETTKLTITAKQMDSTASVSIQGNDLAVGSNTVSVVVKAQDKTKKTYTIKATRQDEVKVMVPVEIGGTTLYVNGAMDESELPAGYEIGISTLNGEEIEIGQGKMQLVWVSDKNGNDGALYIWDGAAEFTKYVEVPAAGAYVIKALPNNVEIPEGYVEDETALNGEDIVCYKKDGAEFFLIYALSPEGKSGFYSYDPAEATIQRYIEPVKVEEPPVIEEPEENETEEEPQGSLISSEDLEKLKADLTEYRDNYLKYKYYVYGLLAIAILELIMIIVLLVLVRKAGAALSEEDDDEDELDEEALAAAEEEAKEKAKAERYAKYASTEGEATEFVPRTEVSAGANASAGAVNARAFEAAEPSKTMIMDLAAIRAGEEAAKNVAAASEGMSASAQQEAERKAYEQARAAETERLRAEAAERMRKEREARLQAMAKAEEKARLEAMEVAQAEASIKEAEMAKEKEAEHEAQKKAYEEACAASAFDSQISAGAAVMSAAAAESQKQDPVSDSEAFMRSLEGQSSFGFRDATITDAEARARAEWEALAAGYMKDLQGDNFRYTAEKAAEKTADNTAGKAAEKTVTVTVRAGSGSIDEGFVRAASGETAQKEAEWPVIMTEQPVTMAEKPVTAAEQPVTAAEKNEPAAEKPMTEEEARRRAEAEARLAERRAARQAKLEKERAKAAREQEKSEKPSWFKRFFLDEIDEDEEDEE